MQMRDFSFLLLIREQRKGCPKVHPPWQEGNVRPVRRGDARALPPANHDHVLMSESLPMRQEFRHSYGPFYCDAFFSSLSSQYRQEPALNLYGGGSTEGGAESR